MQEGLGEKCPELALEWHRAGRGAALATVVETWGSAPRRVGSQLVIDQEGSFEGSVSGGCVEGAVIFEAQEALADGKTRLLTYGVSDGDAFSVGLACGGTIRILVEPVGASLTETVLADLVAARAAKKPVAYIADLRGPHRELVFEGLETRFQRNQSGIDEEGARFIHIHNPPLRLAIVGAVHIAKALARFAPDCGFEPIIVDPRSGFATAERFEGVRLCDEWPDAALAQLVPDRAMAVVLLTHDPKLDDPALHYALRSEVFYIGALGSKRTHAKRIARLQEAGFTSAEIARIHAPVGLDIGAANPEEIAISIMAEILRVLRKGA